MFPREPKMLLGRDISRKMYDTSDTLEKFGQRQLRAAMVRDPLLRSMSCDALYRSLLVLQKQRP